MQSRPLLAELITVNLESFTKTQAAELLPHKATPATCPSDVTVSLGMTQPTRTGAVQAWTQVATQAGIEAEAAPEYELGDHLETIAIVVADSEYTTLTINGLVVSARLLEEGDYAHEIAPHSFSSPVAAPSAPPTPVEH